ncbi:MAG TPA: MATE family efflux transporter [Oscillospiraceae bacterium]|nr:MATE family efflux transporter [Oscillospiraceae bacterium]
MQQENSHELGQTNIKKLLFKYSSPAIIAMLFNSLYNMVDTIFVGRGAGTLAIAGLAISFPIQMLVMAIAQTVGIGAASIISRSLGAGDKKRAAQAAGNAFTIVSILSIAFMVFGLTYLTPLLRLFGATEAILPYAREYMSVILAGSVFFSLAVCSNNIVRAEGFAKVAMYSMLIGAIGNIILDPIFIFTFDMGIRGAALATIIAQFGSFLYLAVFFLRGSSSVKISRQGLKINWQLVPEIFAVGASSFVRTVAGSLFSIVVNNSIAYYGADIHIAVLGVANRLITFTMMPIMGIIQGLQPIIGFNYGAKKFARVKESLQLAIKVASAFALVGYLGMMLFTEQFVRIFNNDPALVVEAVPIIRAMALLIPLIGFQMVGSSLFQAIGRAAPALFLSMSRQLLILIPLVLILPLSMGLIGIFYAFPLSDLLSTIITSLWLRREMRIMSKEKGDGPAKADDHLEKVS